MSNISSITDLRKNYLSSASENEKHLAMYIFKDEHTAEEQHKDEQPQARVVS